MKRSVRSSRRVQPGPPFYLTLIGNIHPHGTRISVTPDPTVNYQNQDPVYSLEAVVRIRGNKVTVSCKLDKIPPNYLIEMIVRAGDPAKAIVDLVAFQRGLGLIVTFDEYKDLDGATKRIAFSDPSLSEYCTAFSAASGFGEVIKLVCEDPPLFMALNDLVVANTLPHQVPANCGKVVEGIRHLIAGPGTDAKKAWPIMRKAMNIDKSFLDVIINNAMHYRHGNRVRIEADITHLILARTWQVFDRYLHLRMRGVDHLPSEEFPVLAN